MDRLANISAFESLMVANAKKQRNGRQPIWDDQQSINRQIAQDFDDAHQEAKIKGTISQLGLDNPQGIILDDETLQAMDKGKQSPLHPGDEDWAWMDSRGYRIDQKMRRFLREFVQKGGTITTETTPEDDYTPELTSIRLILPKQKGQPPLIAKINEALANATFANYMAKSLTARNQGESDNWYAMKDKYIRELEQLYAQQDQLQYGSKDGVAYFDAPSGNQYSYHISRNILDPDPRKTWEYSWDSPKQRKTQMYLRDKLNQYKINKINEEINRRKQEGQSYPLTHTFTLEDTLPPAVYEAMKKAEEYIDNFPTSGYKGKRTVKTYPKEWDQQQDSGIRKMAQDMGIEDADIF